MSYRELCAGTAPRPIDKKVVGAKTVLKSKVYATGEVERYEESRLTVKGF